MGKKTIELKKNEVCYIIDKSASVLIFTETSNNKKISSGVELIIPASGTLDEMKEYASVNLATAIALKIKTDSCFAENLVSWLSDYIQNHGTPSN